MRLPGCRRSWRSRAASVGRLTGAQVWLESVFAQERPGKEAKCRLSLLGTGKATWWWEGRMQMSSRENSLWPIPLPCPRMLSTSRVHSDRVKPLWFLPSYPHPQSNSCRMCWPLGRAPWSFQFCANNPKAHWPHSLKFQARSCHVTPHMTLGGRGYYHIL